MHELAPWLRLIFQRWGRLSVGGLLLLITLLSGMGLLALSGWFITETALAGLLLAAGAQASINLYTPGGGIRLFALTRTVGRYLERVYNHDTVLRQLSDIRTRLFRQLAAAPRSHRRGLSGAQWLSRLTRDVDALDTLYLRLIAPTALAVVVSLLMVLLALILFDTEIALWLGLLLGIALLYSTIGTLARTRQTSRRLSDGEERLRTHIIEHLEGFAELTAAGRTGKHAAWLMRQAHGFAKEQAKVDRRVGWNQALTHLLINLAAILVLWAGFGLFQSGQISGPVLVLLPIALLGLAEVYAVLPEAFGIFGATEASANRLNQDSLDAPGEGTIQATEPPNGTALVATELGVRYDDCPPIFMHFNLTVARGEHLGLVGHSGSGKSTLADALAGLSPAFQGDIARLPTSYLTQSTVLFEDTLKANLLVGDPEASDTQLWRVLELVELAERFASEPDQLETWLGSSGSRLSGGEARRIALARVLLSPAPLLILDEPFTGVDSPTRGRICKNLRYWLQGKAVIALGHGPDALPDTDRVIHLIA
ncbi:thiol reductant ABC exporter subunit CydC [Marinobacter alexandrii]|uniref:thiol reductant ABC exporter subunit CydC n=1 Tax=Marinobacter alexandrii TaxID=2570351 RepID=UPI001FFE6370|nr:thiol reductant ABC exporter subunit CydC [Marinobacter alexandrii]MCK2147623.1 thiol reductant ABC exporter subunit CydC [Marinobacter alexandrii]